MSNIIIGTAGHVDHGKTSLIKALTGTDTDRLKAEKERGITIELGFAYLTVADQKCGIIDVPGHEKFIRNMLAGAGSVDIVLFVVAADEGIMPQSKEHLQILTLLNISKGVIVITKSDIVEPDWLDLVISDVTQQVSGTFLSTAKIIPVSSKTGEGIDTLKQEISSLVLACSQNHRLNAPARLPVDRVFTVDGFGTVVTGTLTDGTLSVGQEIELMPSRKKAKIRSLQVHSTTVEQAFRGQRVAVNLASIKTDEISKGSVLSQPNSLTLSQVIDVKLSILAGSRTVANNSRLHLHYGTDDVLCRVVLLDNDKLNAGQSGYAQLITESPISVKANDRFVVRFYSPAVTVGGGIVLDPAPPKKSHGSNTTGLTLKETNTTTPAPKNSNTTTPAPNTTTPAPNTTTPAPQNSNTTTPAPKNSNITSLVLKETGTLQQKIAAFIADRSRLFPTVDSIAMLFNNDEFDAALRGLITKKEVFLVKDILLHKDFLQQLAQRCKGILKEFHTQNPLLEGIRKDELRSKLLFNQSQAFATELFSVLEGEKYIRTNAAYACDYDFKLLMSDSQRKVSEAITALYLSSGYATPSVEEALALFPREQKAFKSAFDNLIAQGILIPLTPQIYIHAHSYAKAQDVARTFDGEFTLAEFRDRLGTSRKYAVAILEHFDNKGITKKLADTRTLK